MATDEQRFAQLMSACVADPEAVDRRLVLADWLLERGDALGELIQLQCRIETLRPDDPSAAELEDRASRTRYSTHSAANRVARIRSYGLGSPPCWRWPRMACRTSKRSPPSCSKRAYMKGVV